MINDFRNRYLFLSNFARGYPFICDEGLEWKSTEHYYQANKYTNNSLKEQIRLCEKPAIAKWYGRSYPLRKNWNDMKIEVMRRALNFKFSQNPIIQRKLILTGDKYLEEGNTWHDNFWGNCHCKNCDGIMGMNMLGKLLMKLRKEYAKKNTK